MPHKDPEKRKEYQKQYHLKWYAENRTTKLAQNAEYRRTHWEEEKSRIRLNRHTKPGQWQREKAARQRWLDKHPDYTRERMSDYRARIMAHLGPKCVHCGFEDRRALHIDHVNGGGTAMRRFFKNQRAAYYIAIWKQIEAKTEQYQVLCANCNMIKRFDEFGY